MDTATLQTPEQKSVFPTYHQKLIHDGYIPRRIIPVSMGLQKFVLDASSMDFARKELEVSVLMRGRLVVDGLREGPEIVIPDEETMKSLEGLPRGQYLPKFKKDGYEPVHVIEKKRLTDFLLWKIREMSMYCIFPGELGILSRDDGKDPKDFTLFYQKTRIDGPEGHLRYREDPYPERPIDPVEELANEVMVLYSPK